MEWALLPHHLLDRNLLHLVERNLILPAIVKLGRARRRMVGERLRMLKQPFMLKLYRLMYVAMLPAAISPPGELVAERSV
jgi:hypothetical protein